MSPFCKQPRDPRGAGSRLHLLPPILTMRLASLWATEVVLGQHCCDRCDDVTQQLTSLFTPWPLLMQPSPPDRPSDPAWPS